MILYSLSTGGRIGSPGSSGQLGQSVFDYVEKLSGRSSVFHNFLYMGDRISDSTVNMNIGLSMLRFYSSKYAYERILKVDL